MKLKKFLFTFIFLFIFPQIYFAQEKPEAILINDFENNCSEIISLHYDNFLVELHNDPTSTGYIVFSGKVSQDGTNLRYIRHLSVNYPRFRGFDVNRIILIRGENQDKMQVQFWKVPFGAKPPEVNKNFEIKKISSTKMFQKTYAELAKFLPNSINEEFVDSFYWFEGCDFAPNLSDFAKDLSEDGNLTGYLVIYATKKIAGKIKNLALKELTEKHKISPDRLKTIYGGRKQKSEMELWFLPKGEKFNVK